MSALQVERRMSGPGTFAIGLLLIAPAVVALFASSAAAHQTDLPVSGLWFVYEMSFFAGCVGVGIVVALAIYAGLRRKFAAVFVWLMGFSAAAGTSLLWYAAHIFRNPWIAIR